MVSPRTQLEQIICEPQQSSSPQQQQHQSVCKIHTRTHTLFALFFRLISNFFYQYRLAPKMFPFGSVAQPPQQQPPQNQQSRQLIPHPEAVKKMLQMSNVPTSGPPHASTLARMEVLSRPETQVLIQSK